MAITSVAKVANGRRRTITSNSRPIRLWRNRCGHADPAGGLLNNAPIEGCISLLLFDYVGRGDARVAALTVDKPCGSSHRTAISVAIGVVFV